ncbi:TRAP transporter substrate-binding protein [Methylohalobius crimeensis]|uniref:TRAP transporter substrate-binding protein n=1 Tax=Methylohalobius crimeensis TaxID=244365 RepID=UPI0003B5BAED|nr:TRAP transporter substrate-binding protein DctP [Methylohalobius crimeensis]
MRGSLRCLAVFWICVIVLIGGCSKSSEEASEAITWRIALEEVEGSVQDAYAREFKKRMAERSKGRIHVEIYPYGTLGTSPQLTELVQAGALDLTFASPGHLASVIPEVGVFTLHFVFSDDNQINKQVLASEPVREILSSAYQEQGLELIGIVPEGWMAWTADKALTSPADFEGLKIRTMTSPILIKTYEAYGANPTPLPYSEVYSGLQLGQIDGQVNPIFAIEEMSFYEEQDVMTLARHAQFVSTLVASSQWYASLPPEQLAWFNGVVADMVDWIYQKQETFNQKRLNIIKQAGGTEVVELTDTQREAFRQASMGVRQVYIEQAGARGEKLLDAIRAQIENHEAESRIEPMTESRLSTNR